MEVCTHDNGNSMGVLTIQPKYSYIFDRQRAEWCFDFYGDILAQKQVDFTESSNGKDKIVRFFGWICKKGKGNMDIILLNFSTPKFDC